MVSGVDPNIVGEHAALFEQSKEVGRLRAILEKIADIAEGSRTANSLPNIARIARDALNR